MKKGIITFSKRIIKNEVRKNLNGCCVMFCYEPKKPEKIVLKHD